MFLAGFVLLDQAVGEAPSVKHSTRSPRWSICSLIRGSSPPKPTDFGPSGVPVGADRDGRHGGGIQAVAHRIDQGV